MRAEVTQSTRSFSLSFLVNIKGLQVKGRIQQAEIDADPQNPDHSQRQEPGITLDAYAQRRDVSPRQASHWQSLDLLVLDAAGLVLPVASDSRVDDYLNFGREASASGAPGGGRPSDLGRGANAEAIAPPAPAEGAQVGKPQRQPELFDPDGDTA